MNYIFVSDCLWYCGHIFTGIFIILSKNHYNLAVLFVFVGQFITIISRPISRLQPKNAKITTTCIVNELNQV